MESGGSSSSYSGLQTPAQGGIHPGPTNANPNMPQARGPRLTKEELDMLEECNTESFWFRCVPLGLALGGAAAYLVKTGHLQPHPRYGATLKTLGGGFVGYILGKMSYHRTCQDKILEKIPHTHLAESVRKARGLDSIYNDNMPMQGEIPQPGPGMTGPLRPRQENVSSMDSSVDITTRNVTELDDNMRPSLDREVKFQPDSGPAGEGDGRTLTYDELRQRNRQEYQRNMAISPSSPFRQRPFPSRQPSPAQPDDSSPSSSSLSEPAPAPTAMWDTPPPQSPGRAFNTPKGQKNQYGDFWDNN